MTAPDEVVFLLNTLLHDDRIEADLRNHLQREFGPEGWDGIGQHSRRCAVIKLDVQHALTRTLLRAFEIVPTFPPSFVGWRTWLQVHTWS